MESTIELYHKYLDQFMPLLEMREYLKSVEIKPWYVPDIIYFSIHPLSKKLEAMKDLDEHTQKLLKETQFCIRNMETYTGNLTDDEKKGRVTEETIQEMLANLN
jgi:hypothetical protein